LREQALFLASIAALFSATPSAAQETSGNASVSYLMQRFSLSRSEAETRIAVQGDVIALSERLNAEGDPAYGDDEKGSSGPSRVLNAMSGSEQIAHVRISISR
jgi:hypothetical protein